MTEAQLRTLDNIRTFIAANRRPPMVRELMRIEGLKSTAGMYNRLQALEIIKKTYYKKEKEKKCSLKRFNIYNTKY